MRIPISKPFLGTAEIEAREEVILSGWVSQGPKVKEFDPDIGAADHAQTK
jgi:dTDP-4-amino-4,6-dideoxygalactose transaminase